MKSQILGRLFGLLMFVAFSGGVLYNWHLLINEGYYYLKLSGIAPFGVVGGLAIMISPSLAGPPSRMDKKSRAVVWILVLVSLALGGLNFYLMQNYHP
jgi:hypothetical protein